MAITRDGTKIIIKYEVGDSKGWSDINPYTLDDVLNSALTSGDDILKVESDRGTTWLLKVNIFIEGADTYFYHFADSIIWADAAYTSPYVLYSLEGHVTITSGYYAYINFGYNRVRLTSSDNKINKVIFTNAYVSQFGGGEWEDITLNYMANHTHNETALDIFRNILTIGGLLIFKSGAIDLFENFEIRDNGNGLWYDRQAGNKTFRNVKITNC